MFVRITDNEIPSVDSLKKIYDEIRMRDAEEYPKAYIDYGVFRIEFSRASLKKGHVETDARIFLR
jgi:methionyl-tRNA formyltransferase